MRTLQNAQSRLAALDELLGLHRLGSGRGRRRSGRGPGKDRESERSGRNLAHHAGISGPGFLKYCVVIALADQYASAPKGPVGL